MGQAGRDLASNLMRDSSSRAADALDVPWLGLGRPALNRRESPVAFAGRRRDISGWIENAQAAVSESVSPGRFTVS